MSRKEFRTQSSDKLLEVINSMIMQIDYLQKQIQGISVVASKLPGWEEAVKQVTEEIEKREEESKEPKLELE